jgi:hypothetical protein
VSCSQQENFSQQGNRAGFAPGYRGKAETEGIFTQALLSLLSEIQRETRTERLTEREKFKERDGERAEREEGVLGPVIPLSLVKCKRAVYCQ